MVTEDMTTVITRHTYMSCLLTDLWHAVMLYVYTNSIQQIVFLLPERHCVTFGSLLSQIRLSSVTFVHPTQGLKFSAVFLRHFVP